jgi:hypothetical protein
LVCAITSGHAVDQIVLGTNSPWSTWLGKRGKIKGHTPFEFPNSDFMKVTAGTHQVDMTVGNGFERAVVGEHMRRDVMA